MSKYSYNSIKQVYLAKTQRSFRELEYELLDNDPIAIYQGSSINGTLDAIDITSIICSDQSKVSWNDDIFRKKFFSKRFSLIDGQNLYLFNGNVLYKIDLNQMTR